MTTKTGTKSDFNIKSSTANVKKYSSGRMPVEAVDEIWYSRLYGGFQPSGVLK
jgi:hypothetical protein